MDRLPVALVNADTGATLDDEPLDAGTQVTDKLVDSGDLDWRLTDAEDAAQGVADGTYYFAVTIPADFSTDVASADGDTPTAASLQVTYNDANSFLASTLGKTAMAQVQSAVSATIGDQAVDTMLVGLGSARDGFATASDGALTLRAASGDLSTGAHQVADGAVSAADGAAQLASGSGTLASGTDTLASGAATLATGASTLSTGAGSAAAGAATLSDGATKLAAGAATLDKKSDELADGAHQVAVGVDKAAATLSQLPGIESAMDKAVTNLSTIAHGGTVTPQEAVTTLTALSTATANLPTTDATTAADSLTTLVNGAHSLDAGAAALSAGVGTLSTSTTTLATGASSLASGTQQVATGASQLATGASTLSTGAATLQTGSHTLADGATDLATGTATLADGATQVADGTDQVGDGAQQIADGLADGAAQIPDDDADTRATRAEVISSPVGVTSDDLAQAEGFGEGFAPFFIPLALFVGALITWLLLRPVPSRALATPVAGWRTALAGYLPALTIGVAQVAVMIAVIHWGVGLQMSTALGTIAFTLLVAATFLALQQMLMAVLGPAAGKVAILALLMLQLASSGGTYPVETTPVFFRAIHPVLPMSYAVTGLRQTITGGADGRLWLSVAVLAGVLIGSLAITAWRSGRLRTWSLERLHPALSI
jgi:putative membrane protein